MNGSWGTVSLCLQLSICKGLHKQPCELTLTQMCMHSPMCAFARMRTHVHAFTCTHHTYDKFSFVCVHLHVQSLTTSACEQQHGAVPLPVPCTHGLTHMACVQLCKHVCSQACACIHLCKCSAVCTHMHVHTSTCACKCPLVCTDLHVPVSPAQPHARTPRASGHALTRFHARARAHLIVHSPTLTQIGRAHV